MTQSILSCPEKLRFSKDSPVIVCEKPREHLGPHRVKCIVGDIELEIKWHKTQEVKG